MTLRKKKSTTARSTRAHDGNCNCNHGDQTSIASIGLTAIEEVILDICRCVCTGYATGEIPPWEHAFAIAEERIGIVDGPAFVSRCMMLLRAVRVERKGGFSYMTLNCSRITDDERALINLVRAASGSSDGGDVFLAARSIATSKTPTRLLVAARATAALCMRYDLLISAEQEYGTLDRSRPN